MRSFIDRESESSQFVQGTVKSYDPVTKDGVLMSDVDFAEYDLSPEALEGSIFRMLRQGQRILFDGIEDDGMTYVSNVRMGQDGF